MKDIKMVDLQGQYLAIKKEMDEAVFRVLNKTNFINGEEVDLFTRALAGYLQVKHVIPCGNGTDALQLAIMALDLPKNSEIIVPCFCYIAAAEVAAFMGYKVVFADVNEQTFNIDPQSVESLITENTRAIIPVHLFGQCAPMLQLIKMAQKYNLYIIEDNAQSVGATYTFPDEKIKISGTMGHIGTLSFFPSKNLGCMGDGGAVITNDDNLAEKIKMLANHGQRKKYVHEMIGINSRLDTIQAAILNVKLKYLPGYIEARRKAAEQYDRKLTHLSHIAIPYRSPFSSHVFHQYTIKVDMKFRDGLRQFLHNAGIPSMVYYPLTLNKQPAFNDFPAIKFPVSEQLSGSVLSLPMHTELNEDQVIYICDTIKTYFNTV